MLHAPTSEPPSALVPLRPGPLRFTMQVACGRYRNWLLALLAGEAIHSTCGTLLPFALSRIISSITQSGGDKAAVLRGLLGSLVLFVALCAGEFVCGRLNAALQLRVAPRQRQYVARALFSYLHRHSHRF